MVGADLGKKMNEPKFLINPGKFNCVEEIVVRNYLPEQMIVFIVRFKGRFNDEFSKEVPFCLWGIRGSLNGFDFGPTYDNIKDTPEPGEMSQRSLQMIDRFDDMTTVWIENFIPHNEEYSFYAETWWESSRSSVGVVLFRSTTDIKYSFQTEIVAHDPEGF